MVFSAIEIIVLVLIIISAIKIVVFLIKPQAWMNFAKKIWSNSALMTLVLLILAGVVFYYLIQELTIIQILAVIAFTAILIGIGLAKHARCLISEYEKKIKQGNIWKDYWLYALIWVALLGWGAYVLWQGM